MVKIGFMNIQAFPFTWYYASYINLFGPHIEIP